MSDNPLILAIETSCDETAAALTRGRLVLGGSVYTQVALHARFGGVVPEVAARDHVEKLDAVVKDALGKAGRVLSDVEAVAVTYGPGLVGALLCGVSYAKALAYALNVPIVPVNHMLGHIAANFIVTDALEPPFVCLVVSGGHSHIVHYADGGLRVMAKTRDDAAGECLDKAARLLGLPYPGGALLDELAEQGDERAVKLPRARVAGLDFSFSGLKTAFRQALEKARAGGEDINTPDWAASVRTAVVDALVENTMRAAIQTGVRTVALAGGVAANRLLRRRMSEACVKNGLALSVPPPELCTDNAAMIGCAAGMLFQRGVTADLALNAAPGAKIDGQWAAERKAGG